MQGDISCFVTVHWLTSHKVPFNTESTFTRITNALLTRLFPGPGLWSLLSWPLEESSESSSNFLLTSGIFSRTLLPLHLTLMSLSSYFFPFFFFFLFLFVFFASFFAFHHEGEKYCNDEDASSWCNGTFLSSWRWIRAYENIPPREWKEKSRTTHREDLTWDDVDSFLLKHTAEARWRHFSRWWGCGWKYTETSNSGDLPGVNQFNRTFIQKEREVSFTLTLHGQGENRGCKMQDAGCTIQRERERERERERLHPHPHRHRILNHDR